MKIDLEPYREGSACRKCWWGMTEESAGRGLSGQRWAGKAHQGWMGIPKTYGGEGRVHPTPTPSRISGGANFRPEFPFGLGVAGAPLNAQTPASAPPSTSSVPGACLTQLIMVATLATTAATAWDGHMPGRKQLNTVRDFSDTVTVHLGVGAQASSNSEHLVGLCLPCEEKHTFFCIFVVFLSWEYLWGLLFFLLFLHCKQFRFKKEMYFWTKFY